jgi:hypothetical protein
MVGVRNNLHRNPHFRLLLVALHLALLLVLLLGNTSALSGLR